MSLTLSNTTRTRPSIPFLDIKNDILGSKYDLSLNLVGETRSRQVNMRSRQKSYAPNVLSFPFSKTSGEIFITPVVAKREASSFGHSFKKHLTFLYIHGLLHLKGHDHGTAMERLEEKFLAKYG